MIKLGVAGDSASDSYQADDNRGGTFHARTFAWTDWGVRLGRWDLGAWGTYSEPRRTDYAQNWARSAAMWDNSLGITDAVDLLGSGQITGLAAQVSGGAVTHGVLFCGANDWTARNIPSGWPPLGSQCWDDIYNGTMSDAQIVAKADRNIANMTSAVNSLQAAGVSGILLVNVNDMDPAYGSDANYPDTTKYLRCVNAIKALNVRIEALTQSKGIAYARYTEDIWASNLRDITPFGAIAYIPQWGGVPLYGDFDDDPQHLLLADHQHAGSIMQTWTANAVIHALNAKYHLGLEPIWPWLPLREVGLGVGLNGSLVRT